MKITRIAVLAMTALATAFVLPSCTQELNPDDTPVVPQADFTVAKRVVEAEYAELIVRHTGNQDVTWYGFVTEDVETPADELIESQLPTLDRADLHVGTSQTVAVRNLQEAVNYRYIAFAVDEANALFGTPGSLTFNTSPKFDVTFSVEATEVLQHEATFNLGHDGHEILTYMGFCTQDTETEIEVLAAADMATLVTNGKLNPDVTLLQGKTLTVSEKELLHETTYRYIIYGIFDNDGVVISYGTPAACTFTTPIDLSLVNFSATVSNVTKNSAEVSVEYSAKQEDLTWYGFITEDLTSPAASLIAAKVAGLSAADYQTGAQTVQLSDLTPETDYRYIVTGINADGVYGSPADVRFSSLTEAYDNTVFTVTAGEIDAYTATLTITHNGWESFEYCGFLTEDLQSPVADIPVPANADLNLMKGLETTVTLEDLDALTEYRYVVVGRYNGNDYGTRGEVRFTTADDKVEAAYTDFLGSWKCGADIITISQQQNGSTYAITGFYGQDEIFGNLKVVTGNYDAATHEFYLMEQKLGAFNTADVEAFGTNQYGDCDDYLSGYFPYGSSGYFAYPFNTSNPTRIFTAYLDGHGDMVVSGGACNYGAFSGFDFIWVIREGEYAGRGNNYSDGDYGTEIPEKITKVGSASSVSSTSGKPAKAAKAAKSVAPKQAFRFMLSK